MQRTAEARADWVLSRRFGGDPAMRQQTETWLYPIRERILGGARIRPGDRILDIAAREGFIGFEALDRSGPEGTIMFTELSAALLDVCRATAAGRRVQDRCTFLETPAEDLRDIPDASVDVVTVRSILGYVDDRERAIREWRRVLRPGGRLAMIQMFASPEPPHLLGGYDVTPVQDLAAKVKAGFERVRPATFPADLDERAVIDAVEAAGFTSVLIDYEIEITTTSDWPPPDWEKARSIAPIPGARTFGELIEETLTPEEARRLEAHVRPLVEAGRCRVRFPKLYAWAVR